MTNEIYTIEKRFNRKIGKDIFAVSFTKLIENKYSIVPSADFLELESRAKKFGGYYSSFGKGGFIFNNEKDAKDFAESSTDITEMKQEELDDIAFVEQSQGKKFVRGNDTLVIVDTINEYVRYTMNGELSKLEIQKIAKRLHSGNGNWKEVN